MSRASTLIESLEDLNQRLSGMGEDTNMHVANTPQMDIPSEYRGQVKVVDIKDDEAKNYWGLGLEFYVDVARGETDLMTPSGAMASMTDVTNWFSLKSIDSASGVGGSSS